MGEAVKYQDILCRLAIIDEEFASGQPGLSFGQPDGQALDPKVAALVRVGALAAIGSPEVFGHACFQEIGEVIARGRRWTAGATALQQVMRRHDLTDPVLWKIAGIIHEADLDDERYDAPEAPGLDVALRGLSMTCTDEETLTCTGPLFDGLYEYYRRATLLGREPA